MKKLDLHDVEVEYPFGKVSLSKGIIRGRCPRCRQGKIFQYKLLNLPRFTRMHRKCLHCGLAFEREPGFFFGAVYISYGLNAMLVMATVLTWVFLLNELPVWAVIAAISSLIILFLPVTHRYGHILMLYWFGGIQYDPKISRPVDVQNLLVDFRKKQHKRKDD